MRSVRVIGAVTVASLSLTLAACSSGTTSSETSSAASAAASSTPPIASDPAGAIGGSTDPATAAAQAACDQILKDTLTQADAEALVTEAGLTSRIGSVDGAPNAVTTDYIPTRVTLSVEGGVVTECIVG